MEKFGEPPETQRVHGYTAGRIAFGETEAHLRLWPRIATDKTGRWRYIPDHENGELEGDGGTPPDPVAVRPRGVAPRSRTTTAAAENPFQVPTLLAPHSTLPARRPFFGRAKDLEKIAKYLLPEDRSWGVVLDGPGGVGKTALALEAAHRAPVEHFPLKLWFTAKDRELLPSGEQALPDHRVENFYALLNEFGRALGRDDIPKAVPEDRASLVRHALANYRALLLLDNLETFSPEERRRVFELLKNLPSACRALVTSRRRTDGSTAAYNLRLDKLERDAADELLAELGRKQEQVAGLSRGDRDRLYAETGGNPLLLTWVAGQLGRTTGRCRTVDEAVRRLQEAHRLEKVNVKNDPLDFVFGDLVETFTGDETAVLAALVHFTAPARIEWLLPLSELTIKAAENALDGLRDRALLIEDDQASTWLLPPLATRFLRRIRPEAVGACGERLADQAYALAVDNGYGQHVRFPILEANWPRIAAALPVFIAGDNGRLQTACTALNLFLVFYGRWDDCLSLGTAAEARAESVGDFNLAGWRAWQSGYCRYLRGQYTEVLACADRAGSHWDVGRARADVRAQSIRLRGLGHRLAKDFPAAVSAIRESVVLWRNLSPKSREMAIGLNSLAEVLRDSSQLDEAEDHYREALVITRATFDPEGTAICTGNLAGLALDREQWPEAERLSREALDLSEGVRRKEVIAANSLRLAESLARQGRGAEGRYYAERAVTIYTDLRSPELAGAQGVLAVCLTGTEK